MLTQRVSCSSALSGMAGWRAGGLANGVGGLAAQAGGRIACLQSGLKQQTGVNTGSPKLRLIPSPQITVKIMTTTILSSKK